MLRPFGFMKAAAAAGGITDPTDVGVVLWIDGTDWTYQKSATDGTGDITASGQNVLYFVDRSDEGNDFKRRDGANNAVSATGHVEWNTSHFIPAATMTGLTDDMEIYALFSTSDGAFMLAGKNSGSSHIAAYASSFDPTNTTLTDGFTANGAFSYSTNGSSISPSNRGDLETEWSIGANVIAGMGGLDLSNATDSTMDDQFMPLAYTTGVGLLTGDVLHYILAPTSQLDIGTNRADLIDWLKSEGGIS